MIYFPFHKKAGWMFLLGVPAVDSQMCFFFGFRIENIGTTCATTKHPNINELYNRGSVTFRRFFLPHDDCLLLWKIQTLRTPQGPSNGRVWTLYRQVFGGPQNSHFSAVRCDWIDPWHRGKGLVEWYHVWRLLHTDNILHLDHNINVYGLQAKCIINYNQIQSILIIIFGDSMVII